MGLRYNYCDVSVSLLCSEDNSCILGLDEEGEEEQQPQGGGAEAAQRPRLGQQLLEERSDFYGDILMSIPLQSEDSIALLVQNESRHLPGEGYAEKLLNGSLGLSVRAGAIDWIEKVTAHYDFGPLTAYLAVNYLDRFLSSHELRQSRVWMGQLLSMSCLSLAAKMEETKVPPPLEMQIANSNYVFETKTVRRMEMLILSTLKWRMRSITPFSFIQFFLFKLGFDNPPKVSTFMQSADLILCTTRGVEFLEFRPSEVAAAVALTILNENHSTEIENRLSCCTHVNKERVLRCYEAIQIMVSMKEGTDRNSTPSVPVVPESPVGVLDVASESYISDEVTSNSYHAKRRKLNEPSSTS